MPVRMSRQWAGITTWKARSVSRSRRGVLPRRVFRRSGKAKPPWSSVWPPKTSANTTCSCRSAGRGGKWQFLSRNSHLSIRTNQLRRPSATGITGSHKAIFSEAPMAKRQPATKPSWRDVKAELASFDRLGLLALIQDLYAANKDNQAFLHARFGLGKGVLKPYREALGRWLWPDVNQDVSVMKAKQAIS